MKEKFLILGNGIAGHNAIQTILKSQKEAEITVVARENTRTYLRTQLASYAAGEIDDKRFYSCDMNFYKDNNVEFINDTAIRIRKEDKIVVLKSGREVSYDKLIIAIGSANFIPSTEIVGSKEYKVLSSDTIYKIDGICTMRELSDALYIKNVLPHIKKAVIVGGGLLGLEAAWELKQKGLDVTVVEFSQRLLPRQMDESSSEIFRKTAEKTGIKLVLGDSVKKIFVENNKLVSVKTGNGLEIPCDYLQFSIGIRPNVEIAQEAELEVNRGIIVNEFMETSEADIFACGDCTEYEGRVYGLWAYAMASGKTAAKNAMGEKEAIKPQGMATLYNGLDTKIFSAGGIDFDDNSYEGEVYENSNDYRKLFFKDGILKSAILIGDSKMSPSINKAITEGMDKATALEKFMK